MSERRLKIAAIGGRGMPSHYSGVERIWEELLPRLVDNGHDVTAYCRPGVAETDEHKGVRLVTTPAPGGTSAETLTHTRSAVKHASQSGFDVIALHALPPQMFAPLAAQSGAAVVSHVHGLDWQRAKWQQTPLGLGAKIIKMGERRMVKKSHAVAVCAPYLADYYRDTYGLETTVLSNGIVPDDSPFEPDQNVLDELAIEPNRFVVSVGRLVQEKRTQDIVTAQKRIGCRVVIVGDGPDNDWMKSLKAEAGDGVVFAGHRTGRALETLFRCAAAYVTASELEGLPSSVLEAMERKSCVIASDIPPHRLLLEGSGTSGQLFPVGDVDALAGRLLEVLEHKKYRQEVAEGQREHVRSEYAWDVLAEKVSDFYLATTANLHQ